MTTDAEADEWISLIEEYECDNCGEVFDTRFDARDHVKAEHLANKGKQP